MVLAESDLNSLQVSLMRSILIHRKMHFGTETNGFNGESGLNFEWSL